MIWYNIALQWWCLTYIDLVDFSCTPALITTTTVYVLLTYVVKSISFISRMLSLQLLVATWQRDHQQNGDERGRRQKIWFADTIPRCDSLSVPHHTDICPMWPCAICEGWLHIGLYLLSSDDSLIRVLNVCRESLIEYIYSNAASTVIQYRWPPWLYCPHCVRRSTQLLSAQDRRRLSYVLAALSEHLMSVFFRK